MTEMIEAGQVDAVGIERILAMIPHRYPFLMIDRVIDMVPAQSATGIKNVTINEPFFQGHFPGRPVMPGVLIVEAMAQTAAVLVMHTYGQDAEDRLVYFMTIDKCRFRKPVMPGDVLRLRVQALRARGTVWKFQGRAEVNGALVAEADYSAMLVGGGAKVEAVAPAAGA
jgi:3-hydroxyacyl-[acyl-carrier-protein] dehydratase